MAYLSQSKKAEKYKADFYAQDLPIVLPNKKQASIRRSA